MDPEHVAAPAELSLRSATLTGVRWIASGSLLQQAAQLVVGIVLMRLLTPTDFGLLGMIVIFTGFILLFGDIGLSKALIQAQTVTDEQLSTVSWLSLLFGFMAGAAAYFAAGRVAAFYDEPRLILLMQLASIALFMTPLSAVPRALLSRQLRFKALAVVETTAMLAAGAGAIAMAFHGFGVFSLMAQMIGFSFLHTVFCWASAGWKPARTARLGAVRDISKYGLNLVGATVFNYLVRNVDDLLIGKFVGSAGLGIYTRAYGLMLVPLSQVTSVLGRVLFPALSRIQDDVALFKSVYLQTIGLIALVTVPIGVGLLVTARPMILTLFGPQWLPVVPIIQVLSLVAVKQPISATTGWIFQAKGRTDLLLKWTVFDGVITVFAFVVGLRWGILGVASAYVIRSYLVWYPAIEVPGRLIGMNFREYIVSVSGVFGCAATMGAIVWGLGVSVANTLSAPPKLALLVLTGIASYFLLLKLFNVRPFREAQVLVKEQWRELLPPPEAVVRQATPEKEDEATKR